MRASPVLLAFNRGLMAKNALARVDLKRTALSAEVMTNWLPSSLGSMALRPGTEHLGSTKDDATAILLPFVFSATDTALLELTDGVLRVWQDGEVFTAATVTATVANGDFATDLSGWTDVDEVGGVSTFAAGGMRLLGDGTSAAERYQELTISSADYGVPHTMRVATSRYAGECVLRVGSSPTTADLAGPITLRPGDHVITFVPTSGAAYVRLSNRDAIPAVVDAVGMVSGAVVDLPTPWATGDLPRIRWVQSGDVVFVCDGAHAQQRVERWGAASWSVVDYRPEKGPFFPVNISDTVVTSSAYASAYADTALASSAPVFSAGHVGALFRLERTGQTATANITGGDQWTAAIRVTGITASRTFTVNISGKAPGDVGVVSLQRSLGGEGDWFVVATYTADTTVAFADGLDNNIAYYRIGVASGDFDSDIFTVSLVYAAGISTDVVRVTEYVSPTAVYGVTVSGAGGYGGSATWWEGRWSGTKGWPSAVALHEGRLWWVGADRIDGSVSDAYTMFDDEVEGDSGPISRNLAIGPINTATWLAPLDRLLVGTIGLELQAKSSSLDEPLTPTAFALKTISTQGSARIPPVQVDTSVVFVHRNGKRVYEISPTDNGYGYLTSDTMTVVPGIGGDGVVRLAVQRQPDTRIYCVRADGTMAIVIHDKAEDLRCWVEYETDGFVEDVTVLPSASGDDVYLIVRRVINGSDRRFVEQVYEPGLDADPALARLADVHHHVAGPVSSVPGLAHLEGETVVLWGNGKDLGTAVVTSGVATLPESAVDVTVGLPYTARFKSSRIVLSDRAGDHVFMSAKIIAGVGLILGPTHAQGLRYGQDFDYLDDMPLREGYAVVDGDTIHNEYEGHALAVNGTWTPDARLCMEAASPRPCTVVACVLDASGNA